MGWVLSTDTVMILVHWDLLTVMYCLKDRNEYLRSSMKAAFKMSRMMASPPFCPSSLYHRTKTSSSSPSAAGPWSRGTVAVSHEPEASGKRPMGKWLSAEK